MATIAELVAPMLAAAKGSLARDWPKARAYAQPEFDKLARSMLSIGELYAAGEVSPDEARALFSIHRNTTVMVLLTVQGLGILAVENAVNAALGAVREAVNGVVGFALI